MGSVALVTVPFSVWGLGLRSYTREGQLRQLRPSEVPANSASEPCKAGYRYEKQQ